ncbi:hypothetical protein H8957_016226, partial [Semnopithecus entellus]
MLTLAFDFLSQEPDFLTIAFNVYFEGTAENGSEQGSYDADKGIFTIHLPKETPGQHFEGLNMCCSSGTRKIRTHKTTCGRNRCFEIPEEVVDDEEFDWEIEGIRKCFESAVPLWWLQDELNDIIKDPDFTPAAERKQKHLAAELAKFDPDRYLADLFEDEAVEQILKYNSCQKQENHAALVSFSEEKKYQLQEFVNKSRACRQVYYSLIDILLKDVESAWNIRKLSPTPCWLETWTNVHDIMVSFGRRMLCYPLYRHFKLAMNACGETIKILQLGKSAVLKCLLDIHKIFQENDPAYILNDLYISDYCVWIQKVKSKTLAALAEALKEVSLTKAQLGLELEELEAAALLVQEEESALKAAHSVSGQQKLCSSSEASDSEDSDSTVTSGNEDSDSDSEQDELKDSPSETVSSLQGPFLQESGALLIVDGGICTNTAIQESDTMSGPLIEELGEQLKTIVQVSKPKGTTVVNHSNMQERDGCQTPNM